MVPLPANGGSFGIPLRLTMCSPVWYWEVPLQGLSQLDVSSRCPTPAPRGGAKDNLVACDAETASFTPNHNQPSRATHTGKPSWQFPYLRVPDRSMERAT